MLIANILKKQQPEMYRKLMGYITKNEQLIDQLEYREQPDFSEDNYRYKDIQRLMTERKAVHL